MIIYKNRQEIESSILKEGDIIQLLNEPVTTFGEVFDIDYITSNDTIITANNKLVVLYNNLTSNNIKYGKGNVAKELDSYKQIINGNLVWPEYTQDSLELFSSSNVNGLIPVNTEIVRVNGFNYEIFPKTSGIVELIDEDGLMLVVNGTQVYLNPININRLIHIKKDTYTHPDAVLKISNGGGFVVDEGINLNISSDIEAGHYQIFFGDGTVTTDFVNAKSNRNSLSHVKVAWFGAKNDAKTQATYGTNEDGTNNLGDLPSGTDSTLAIKKAIKLAQTASYHGGKFLEINSPCTVVFPPKGHIIASGNNWLGNQLFLQELSILDSNGKNGINFKLLPEFEIVRYSEYDYEVDFNGCTVYWIIEDQNDYVLSSTVLINRFVAKGKGNILPCGTTLSDAGGLIKNNAIFQKGSENENFFNSLSAQEVDWTFGVSGLGTSQTGTDAVDHPANICFIYDGYSLGDRLRIKGGTYRGIKGIIDSNNPESVEMNAEDSDFRCYGDGAVFFNYKASFSQHKIERCGIFMKGNNQTVLKCRGTLKPAAGEINRITKAAQFVIDASRLEGSDGYKKTIVDANFGQFRIIGLHTALGMTAENDSSIICSLDDYATATIEGGYLPGRVRLGFVDIDYTKSAEIDQVRSPMLEIVNASIYNTDGIDKFVFNGKDYGYAILQDTIIGKPVPLVYFNNAGNSSQRSYTQYGKNPMPPCTYYGTFRKPFYIDTFKLSKVALSGAEQGNEYIHNAVTLFPSYCVIEDILIDKNPSTSIFNRLKMVIGNSTFFFDISSANLRKINTSIIQRKISVPTSVESKRVCKVTWVDSEGVDLTGGTPPSHLTIKYRAIENAYEIPTGNINGDAVEIG